MEEPEFGILDNQWMLNATCRGLSANLFHPLRGDVATQREALKVCNGDQRKVKDFKSQKFHLVGPPPCPMKEKCLEYIMSIPASSDMCGVYAGLTHKQRVAIRRRQAKETQPVKLRPRCGTFKGYVFHVRNNETPCEACRRENARYKLEHKATRNAS